LYEGQVDAAQLRARGDERGDDRAAAEGAAGLEELAERRAVAGDDP
jgi:hypothetical protein